MIDETTKVAFTRATGMGAPFPEAPPEYAGAISAFGFPGPLKKLHKALRTCINRIPRDVSEDQKPLMDEFIRCIQLDLSDQDIVARISQQIGFRTAREDLVQKRINSMTPLDYISPNKALDTPDQEAVSRVRRELMAPDHERFAKVLPTKGGSVNEWDFMRDEDPNL